MKTLQTLRKALETKAIYIAHTGAEKMDGQGYAMIPDTRFATKATVVSPTGKRYTVNVGPEFRYCGCPFCLENKICKHLVWVANKIGDAGEEEYRMDKRIAEHEEKELAKYEIGDAKF